MNIPTNSTAGSSKHIFTGSHSLCPSEYHGRIKLAGSSVLDNGIKLGGVFSDFHEKISRLQDHNINLSETCAMLEEDRLALFLDRDFTRQQWRMSARSLLLQSAENAELSDVFDQIRSERSILEACNIELQCALTEQNYKHESLSNYVASLELTISDMKIKHKELKHVVATESEENKSLREIIYSKDEELHIKNQQLSDQLVQLDILSKSLQAKDKQLISIVKDRDRFKYSLEAASKALLPKHRNVLGTEMNKTLTTTKVQSKSHERNFSSPSTISGLMSPSESSSSSTSSKAHGLLGSERDDLEHHDSFIPRTDAFDIRARQYESVIRNLRKEISSLRSNIR